MQENIWDAPDKEVQFGTPVGFSLISCICVIVSSKSTSYFTPNSAHGIV